MILSATLSKPTDKVKNVFGKEFYKIKIKYENSSNGGSYFLEMFTKTQVFHEHKNESELNVFFENAIGKLYKACVQKTESEEISFLTNKKGKTTKIVKKIQNNNEYQKQFPNINHLLPLSMNKKNYILQEGQNIPFLILLGIMNSEGKVLAKKNDKFRQINRFLEFIDDVIPDILKLKEKNNEDKTIRIIDFGCGKSYLTFAVHYYLTEIKKINCEIKGLDLKKEVIDYCNEITKRLNLKNLVFTTGNIQNYDEKNNPDLIITLHACDTATDYALKYAVEKNTKAILSVPCCQHQINSQLQQNLLKEQKDFEPLLKWGIIREKFSALLTDSLRGEWLESKGYKVQMLEFIDMEHTPKNILIRAVIKENSNNDEKKPSIISSLKIKPEIWN